MKMVRANVMDLYLLKNTIKQKQLAKFSTEKNLMEKYVFVYF